jgi:hypothetical protein
MIQVPKKKSVEEIKQLFNGNEPQPLEKAGIGPLAIFDSRTKIKKAENPALGHGIFAIQNIPKGTILYQMDFEQKYTEVLTFKDFLQLPELIRRYWRIYAWNQGNAICGPLLDPEVIQLFNTPDVDYDYIEERIHEMLENATKIEASNYMNHSCEGNAGFLNDVNLVAIRDIKQGEMITYDYALSECSTVYWEKCRCECGSRNCRSWISGDDYKLPEVQDRYKGYFLSRVQFRIDSFNSPESLFGKGPFSELHHAIVLNPHPNKNIGRGLFASQRIPKGAPLWMCRDPLRPTEREIPLNDLQKLLRTEDRDFYLTYGYQLSNNSFIVPASKEVITEIKDAGFFMNHSCDPTVHIIDDDLWVASRDIEPGEEICYDYGTTESLFDRIPVCGCGSLNCRGQITKDDWKRKDIREKYAQHFAPYLLTNILSEHLPLQC